MFWRSSNPLSTPQVRSQSHQSMHHAFRAPFSLANRENHKLQPQKEQRSLFHLWFYSLDAFCRTSTPQRANAPKLHSPSSPQTPKCRCNKGPTQSPVIDSKAARGALFASIRVRVRHSPSFLRQTGPCLIWSCCNANRGLADFPALTTRLLRLARCGPLQEEGEAPQRPTPSRICTCGGLSS